MTDRRVASGYPFEAAYGYVRAIRVGDLIFVSGTTARGADLALDVEGQLAGAIGVVETALREAGADLRHAVRTVVYLLDMSDAEAVARAHRAAFGAAPPASTLVQVAGLTPPGARVEIEVTAVIRD